MARISSLYVIPVASSAVSSAYLLELGAFFCVGTFIALLKRAWILLASALLFAALILIGASAFEGGRAVFGLQWLAAALATWTLWELARSIRGEDDSRESLPWNPRTVSWIKKGALVFCVLLISGAVRATIRSFEEPEARGYDLVQLRTDILKDLSSRAQCRAHLDTASALHVHKGRIRPNYRVTLRAGEYVPHWSSLFKAKDYDRSIFELLPVIPSVYLVAPEALMPKDERGEYIFVGVVEPHPKTREESFAVTAVYEQIQDGGVRLVGCR